MPVDVDRYPKLGKKTRISGPEEALAMVRAVHPTASQHGSTGAERSWTIGDPRERVIVAHHWNPWRGQNRDIWWIRIAPSEADGIPDAW